MSHFRPNIAALIQCNNKYVGCCRLDHGAWQCVQGGLEPNDTSLQAGILREIEEELGIPPSKIKIQNQSRFWRRYYFPEEIRQTERFKDNLGQEQMWFLVQIESLDLVCLEKACGEFSKVQLFSIDELIKNYSPWKKASLFDFCREINIM